MSRLMHTFARNYTGMFNHRHGRTGTLWEGRYKACLVDSEGYFLACSRYIELNPVRAWIAAEPADYPWSSHRANAGGTYDPLLPKDNENRVTMDVERVKYWLGEGAQATDRVARFLEAAGVTEKTVRNNPKRGAPGKAAIARAKEKADKVAAAAEATAE